MVIHHSHGIDYPYSCDGEGRQADRQDDPGSHWAGSEQTLSQAWGERGGFGSERRHNTRDQVGGVGEGVGLLTHRGTHRGRHERTEGERHSSSAPESPATSTNLQSPTPSPDLNNLGFPLKQRRFLCIWDSRKITSVWGFHNKRMTIS